MSACSFLGAFPSLQVDALVISAQQTFYCSRRTASETSNGTHTLHSKSQSSLRAASYDTYTHYSKKNPSGPKTNTIPESITAKHINTGERGGRCRLCSCGVMAPASLHHTSPPATLHPNPAHHSYITVSLPDRIRLICVTIRRDADWIIWIW